MNMTLQEIAGFLGGQVVGATDAVINEIRPIEEASEGDITFIISKKYLAKLKTTKATAIIAPPKTEANGKNLIIVPDPYVAFGNLSALFYPLEHGASGVSVDSYIEDGAIVSPEATVFAGAYVSCGAKIEKGAVLYPGVYIGRNAHIGENSIIYANVTVYYDCVIGKRVILHSGVVVGGHGFGFAAPGSGNVKIPQVGFVQIDDDVEIGANTTIDRATIAREKTWIQRNVKIDNLVQIAHNVVIGENSVITAQVGISGSTKLGKSVIVGGQTGFVGHINIGDNVIIAAGSAVIKNIAPGQIVSGRPTQPHQQFLRVEVCRLKLPEMKNNIEELVKKVESLQKQINNQERDKK
jgi:UDP-3-O-[3-hydroxymyristoyl] glucosamine N-acyltransferase